MPETAESLADGMTTLQSIEGVYTLSQLFLNGYSYVAINHKVR